MQVKDVMTGADRLGSPVIDEAGRPVRVLSATDLHIHVLARGGGRPDWLR